MLNVEVDLDSDDTVRDKDIVGARESANPLAQDVNDTVKLIRCKRRTTSIQIDPGKRMACIAQRSWRSSGTIRRRVQRTWR